MYRDVKQAFTCHRTTLGGAEGAVYVLEHLTSVKCFRCEARSEAIYIEDAYCKRRVDWNYCFCMKCVDSIHTRRIRDWNVSINTLRLMIRGPEARERQASGKPMNRERRKRSICTRIPQRLVSETVAGVPNLTVRTCVTRPIPSEAQAGLGACTMMMMTTTRWLPQ
jgi:hypothetical protein